MADRPFRTPAISLGYPLDADERRRVRAVARKDRWMVRNKQGEWEVRRDGASRATARSRTQQEAVAKAREIVSSSGGGELIVHGKDGHIRDRNTIAPSGKSPAI